MLKRMLFLFAITAPAYSYSAVYQCKVNGQTVFSDQPCGNDAKKIEIKAPTTQGGASMAGDGVQDFLRHREKKQQVERIDRDIDRLEKQKTRAQRNMDNALIDYQRQRARANNNLAGAIWEGSLASEADVMRQRYQTEIDGADREINRLREERNRILSE
ncbi:DUF4124 domain-containing protein [Marinobacter sp. X15-166B]|uniref:DUF4124 domain-containing protein n=1 Tax=Marinobacter sp. X15-166B TaxID=1897620 RepID=UPI00085BB968|nr:DUF4124 domain-containing protein [Marinobacter sp. X15-166B]OEY66790.1 hypothetical protein BG841_10215 [Marinobacter sp. X15-166B]